MIILHIPHSSTQIPDDADYCVSASELHREKLLLTDWVTEELFASSGDHALIQKVVAPVSRLFCDMERFANDAEEPMVLRGMGVCYTSTGDGKPLRRLRPEVRQRIIEKYYDPHHWKLSELVDQAVRTEQCLIVDCHSFPSFPLPCDLDQNPNRPDICIGTDPFHTPDGLAKRLVGYFEGHGFTVAVNAPYSGTIVPMKFYKKDRRVHSVMIEVNRKLYLLGDTAEKNEEFERLQKIIRALIVSLGAGYPYTSGTQ